MTVTLTKLHWHALWNMPGYLPESDPFVTAYWEDARDYLVDELALSADNAATWSDEDDDEPAQNSFDLAALADELREEADIENGWSGYAGGLAWEMGSCSDWQCQVQDSDQ